MIFKKTATVCAVLGMIIFSAVGAGAEPDWETIEGQQNGSTAVTTTTTTSATTVTEQEEASQTEATTTATTTAVSAQETTSATTTVTEQPVETYETTTTTSGIITYDTPTLSPTKVELEVGEVTDSQFEVQLNISPETTISGAEIYVQYDNDLIECVASEINEYDIGGIAVDGITDGQYTFTYMNTIGTDYSGTYSTLTFKIKDNTMTSTVIYVVVNSLEDTNLLSVSNVIKNGIVNNREAVPAEAEINPDDYIKITVEKSDEAVSLESLGITDIKDVTVSDGQLAIVEDGMLTTLATGETDLIVTHSDDSKSYYTLVITEPQDNDLSSQVTVKKLDPPKNKDSKGLSIGIIIAVIVAIIAIVVEYIMIMKPFEHSKRTRQTIYKQDSDDEEDTDEESTDDEDNFDDGEADEPTEGEDNESETEEAPEAEQEDEGIELTENPEDVFDE